MSDSPIRILHVIGSMNRGGAEVMIMNLYRNIDRSKVQFDFVVQVEEKASFDDEIVSLGGRIFHCPAFNAKNYFLYKKWWNQFFEKHHKEYRAVHGHIGRSVSTFLKIARKYHLYTIAHSHNTAPKGIKSFLITAYAWPTRFLADFYFACSVDAGVSRYGTRISKNQKKFKVLNNAIETRKFQFDEKVREEIRREYGIEQKIVIGHIGRFVNQKNHIFLLDIFEKIHSKCQDTILMLVGDGELRDSIQTKVKRMGLDDAVIFIGVQEDVSVLYQAMDVFVFPSLFEGLGIVAVEAQTTGLQCVISDAVSKECIVTKNQVSICSLKESAEKWAEIVLKNSNYVRKDSSEQVIAHGYDIHETAKWLSNFYMEIKK